MNEVLPILLGFFLIGLLIVCIIVIVIRWVLRINVRVSLLEKIANPTEIIYELKSINGNLKSLNSPWHKCECCNALAPDNYFKKIDSGQYICNNCRSRMAEIPSS
jgi:hypothetical protein